MDTKKLEKMIKDGELEYPLLNKDNIERMERATEVLKECKDKLMRVKDEECNYYLRKRYQSVIDVTSSLINFLTIRTLGD